MHLTEGRLQAYFDDVLTPWQRGRVERHLRRCEKCERAAAEIAARRNFVDGRLLNLVPSLEDPIRATVAENRPRESALRVFNATTARRRLADYEQSRQKEAEMPLYRRWASRGVRPGWVALVVVLALIGSLSLPPVRAFAGAVLGLFRVQEIEVVEFSPTALFGEEGPDAAMQSLQKVMDEQVNVTVAGEPQSVDEATLRSLSSMPVRLPQDVSGEPHYVLQPSADVSIEVDLPRLRALLTELGYTDVSLPDALDGAEVSVALAPSAVAAYGVCEPSTEEWSGATGPESFAGDCIALVQMRSPAISAPAGLDAEQLGQAYLQLLGMSAEEAAAFSQRIDWTVTLVMPLPRSEVTYEELPVDGVTGVLIRPTQHRFPTDEYLLMWVNDGIVYALTGAGSTLEAQQIANSLQ